MNLTMSVKIVWDLRRPYVDCWRKLWRIVTIRLKI